MSNLDLHSPDLSVVIPCYNEEDNIPILLQRFHNVFGILSEPKIELILCDNGSTDNTGSIIDYEISKNKYEYVKKVAVKYNKGYGFGVFSGLKVARAPLLAVMHADLQTDPCEILKAYNMHNAGTLGNNRLLIKGCRQNRRLLEKIVSSILKFLTRLIIGMNLFDINAQPKLFPKEIMAILAEPPDDFTFELYLLAVARQNNYNIIEFPVESRPRIKGESKGGSGSKLITKLRIIGQYLRYLPVLRSSLGKSFKQS